MRRSSAAALLLAMLGVPDALAEDIRRWPDKSQVTPFHVDDPSRWGQPSRVVEPAYPKDALAAGLTGYVDVEGRIGARESMEEAVFKPDSPQSEPFVATLKEVLPLWKFNAPLANDCLPSDERVTTRVWFELKDGQPRISVSRRATSRRKDPEQHQPIRKVMPAYPRSMQLDGLEGPSAFERESIAALKRWVYPALPEGQDKIRRYCKQIQFNLVN